MGIQSLNKLLRNHCVEVFEEIHISEYAYKKLAIDISLYLCKFKTVCGNRWLSAFLNLVSCLRKNEIHCVFIYDNGAPPEKGAERAERAAQREKNEIKVYKLEDALNKYHLTGEIDECLIELDKKEKNKAPQRLLQKQNTSINMNFIEAKIEKMRDYILDISSDDFLLTKKLFDILNVPYYDAPLEAETMCADLCKRGIVDGVLSEDTDVLAYSAPIFLTKINTSNETCVRISHAKMLEALNLKDREFLDLCIMCGTDYNKNIPNVGPETAYKYITKYKTIEGVEEAIKLDISILKHTTSRKLFLEYERSPITSIPYCGIPDFEKLKEFIFKHNLNLNIDNLQKNFFPNIIILEEEEKVMPNSNIISLENSDINYENI